MAVAGVVAAAAAAQNPPQPPVFESRVTLVEVEVSVLDRDRRPVRGLTAADFKILEEGTLQEVQTFAAVELPPPPTTAWMRETAADVRGNAPRQGRTIAIVLDDWQLTQRMVPKVKAIARLLIGELSSGDQAAVVFSRDNSHSQEFTEDRARLLRAVESVHMGIVPAPIRPPPQPRGAYSYIPTPDTGDASTGISQRNSVAVLARVAAALGEAPKRRKAIFYLSPGVPIDPAARSATMTALREGLSDVIRDAALSNVTIYALDPGLQDLSSVLPTQRREFLQTLTDKSGGSVLGERDDLKSGVAQIFRETGSYYLLGYQSPRTEADGKLRAIEVKVERPGVTVRSRTGYHAPRPATAQATARRGSGLDDATAEMLPKPDIQLQAFAAPFALAGRAGPTLAVIVGVRHPAPADGSRVRERMQLQLSAFAAEGKLRGSRRASYGFGLLAGGPEVAYELVSQLDVPPGRYQLRIAAGSELLGKTGSVYCDVDVPDFAKGALTVSGLVLTADPAPLQIGGDGLSALLPVSPTSVREFSPATAVTAFARLYQRAKAPSEIAVVLSIVNGSGARVFRANEPLAASLFAQNGAADYRLQLPIAGLEPGPYLLTLEAGSDGQTAATQNVRFAVVP